MPIKHPDQSARGDNGDAGAVQPSWWNKDHVLTGLLALLDQAAPTPNVVFTLNASAQLQLLPYGSFAPSSSPNFTGVPLAPTPDPSVNSNQIATMAALQTAIANLVASAPTTLNTLNEIAAALGNDPNFSATITASLGNRLRIDASGSYTTGQQAQGRANLGLGTASTLNAGTAANNVVQLDGSAKLPAIDGSQLINLPAGTIAAQADAQAGTDNIKTMTALRVAQAIAIRAPHGHLWGLTLSNDATTPNTVLDIAAGEAASQNAWMMSAAAFTKNCNAAWAVGTGNGALDSGSALAANTWYHVFQIMRTDTWLVDYLLSTSATAPAMPSGYTEKRRIGSIKTDGSSHIIAFKQVEDSFYLSASSLDLSTTSAANNTDITVTLAVPTGVRVQPLVKFAAQANGSPSNGVSIAMRSPDLMAAESAPAPDGGTLAGSDAGFTSDATANARVSGGEMRIHTNTSGQVVVRPYNTNSIATMAATVRTYGWIDGRGRLS